MRYGLLELSHYFECSEQREYEDYIYRTEDLVLLKGNRLRQQAQLDYPLYEREQG